jgi:5,10-methylenetetrahydrofolate reductase
MGLRAALRSGKFVITTDVVPPKGTDLSRALASLDGLQSRVDGINVAELPSAVMRLGSLPVCRILLENGFDPILQVTCRDRNRLALQSDLLGAALLGIENVLVLGGDDVSLSDHQDVKPVFDVDTVGLLRAARCLQRGCDMAGHDLRGAPNFCLGASVNPAATFLQQEIDEMATKAEAGAEFFQSQPIYDIEAFSDFQEKCGQLRTPVLAGVFLLSSARMARYMDQHVPEVMVPQSVIREMEDAADPATKGLEIAARVLRELQGLCAGAHIMTLHQEDQVQHVLDEAGL